MGIFQREPLTCGANLQTVDGYIVTDALRVQLQAFEQVVFPSVRDENTHGAHYGVAAMAYQAAM